LLCITALTAHADSGRTQVESFIGGYIEQVEQSGSRSLSNDDPKKYISAWPQFSLEHLVVNGKDPAKIEIGFFAGTKWAVASSSPRETVVINVGQSVLNDPPSNPNTIVGILLFFETRQIPGKGWKIIVNESDGSAVIKKKQVLTWREYSSRGYKDAIDRVYSGESSARTRGALESQNRQTSQMCEAQKQTCKAGCGPITYWNGRSYVDNPKYNSCDYQCSRISCN
jgi:hypothetical protein